MPTSLPPGLLRLGTPLPDQLHPEAALLGRCVRAGLPVPTGAVLLDGSNDVGPLSPAEHVVLRVLGAPVAVRVPTDDPAVVAAALRTARLAVTGRKDVLLLRAVPSVHAGRAVLRDGLDRVRAVEGEAHEVDASDDVRLLLVPRLDHRWQRAHRGADEWRTPLPPWGMRLSRLLRAVRRTLGDRPYDVVWADDGRTTRLLGVRPADSST